jgi:methylaspartate ammonia-lyase
MALKTRDVKGYLAGSAVGTDRSGQVIAHLAAAASPDLLQLSPGGGVDTPHAIAVNEIERVLAISRVRRGQAVG